MAPDDPVNDSEVWVVGRSSPPNKLTYGAERMMFRDRLTYLPDDILRKDDRTVMAFGLETRVPLLDHRVAELAWGFRLR